MIFAKKTGLEKLAQKLQSERADETKQSTPEPLYTPREEESGAPLFGTRKDSSEIVFGTKPTA